MVSVRTEGENGLHVDVTLASSTTTDERAEFYLREWLESIPHVRLIVIEYYETRYVPPAN